MQSLQTPHTHVTQTPCAAHAVCDGRTCYPPFDARRQLLHTFVYSRSDGQRPEGIGSMLQWRKPGLILAAAAQVPWFGRLVNAHDGLDYAPFFGLGDPHCDAAASGAGPAAAHRYNGSVYSLKHLSHLRGALVRMCTVIEAAGPPATLRTAVDNILKHVRRQRIKHGPH